MELAQQSSAKLIRELEEANRDLISFLAISAAFSNKFFICLWPGGLWSGKACCRKCWKCLLSNIKNDQLHAAVVSSNNCSSSILVIISLLKWDLMKLSMTSIEDCAGLDYRRCLLKCLFKVDVLLSNLTRGWS